MIRDFLLFGEEWWRGLLPAVEVAASGQGYLRKYRFWEPGYVCMCVEIGAGDNRSLRRTTRDKRVLTC